jgi:chemotaxis protein CheD
MPGDLGMNAPENVIEIFLQPGELFFGDRYTRIRTVLGSCVSLVFWHPDIQVGGMCHFMLPNRIRMHDGKNPDGRYADEAMIMLLREIDACGLPRKEYQVKVFGGGNMFDEKTPVLGTRVGSQNINAARDLLEKHGFSITSEHVGSTGHRNVIFDVWSGKVWLKHVPKSAQSYNSVKPPQMHCREQKKISRVVMERNHVSDNGDILYDSLPG